MKSAFIGKGIEINESLRDWLNKKADKLDKYLRDNQDVQVKLSQQRKDANCCEITIPMDGSILRVEEIGADMYACIDKAIDKIVRQIRRHRTKLDKRLRQGAFEKEPLDEPLFEDAENALVRIKRFSMKPMTAEDAIAQMEMLGHSFFLFLNDETRTACVVYRRADGNYGLLQPDNV